MIVLSELVDISFWGKNRNKCLFSWVKQQNMKQKSSKVNKPRNWKADF